MDPVEEGDPWIQEICNQNGQQQRQNNARGKIQHRKDDSRGDDPLRRVGPGGELDIFHEHAALSYLTIRLMRGLFRSAAMAARTTPPRDFTPERSASCSASKAGLG